MQSRRKKPSFASHAVVRRPGAYRGDDERIAFARPRRPSDETAEARACLSPADLSKAPPAAPLTADAAVARAALDAEHGERDAFSEAALAAPAGVDGLAAAPEDDETPPADPWSEDDENTVILDDTPSGDPEPEPAPTPGATLDPAPETSGEETPPSDAAAPDDEAARARSTGQGSGFGRRRTDRVAEAVVAASRAAAGLTDPAVADRVARPDEAARMTQVNQASIQRAKERVQPLLLEVIDVATVAKLPRAELAVQITDIVGEILSEQGAQLNLFEQRDLVTLLVNDMVGLGPIEPLIEDDTISEVMVNGPYQIYIERNGRLELSDVTFRDEAHVMNIATRIVAGVGRRVDESSPICDARLKDGSRVNVIVPPLAIDGPVITIRKFKKDKLTLEDLVAFGAASPECAELLKIVSACRCNILISGGTGSGKTTLLNCLTRFIDESERVITCEDAAELQLQQPHVVRLETRPPNLEGIGEITMRDLVRNCLRMRPERIIVGEVRGPEAFDLLQAMNTGHDGSMGTIHANNPREAISRLENMIATGGFNMPAKSVREQIAAALTLIVQTQRLRDGSRKVTHITEVLGMEGEVVTLQDLFVYDFEGEDDKGRIVGRHRATGLRPAFWERAKYFGLEEKLAAVVGDDLVDDQKKR